MFILILAVEFDRINTRRKKNRLEENYELEQLDEKSILRLERLKKVLNLKEIELNFMKANFDTSSLTLVDPGHLNDVLKHKKCTLLTHLKPTYADNERDTPVLVKLEHTQTIISWFNRQREKSYCSHELLKQTNKYEKLEPIEYFAHRELSLTRMRLRKFLPHASLVQTLDGDLSMKKTVQIFTFKYNPNVQDLRQWFVERKYEHGDSYVTLEAKLKTLLRQMHSVIESLLDKNFLYTDFKPENVLVNLRSRKSSTYLINLDALVWSKNFKLERVCKITNEYFPPVLGSSNQQTTRKLIATFLRNEASHAIDRLLTWQFCMSIFSLVCETYELKVRSFKERSVFDYWRNDNVSFARHFKCGNSKISNSLYSLFDSCLYRNSKNSKSKRTFVQLIEHEWFEHQR